MNKRQLHGPPPPPGYDALTHRVNKLSDYANLRVVWSRDKPTVQGVWFEAKWQRAGYFHVQRYRATEMVAYLQQRNGEFWFGPLTEQEAAEEWTRFISCHEQPPGEK